MRCSGCGHANPPGSRLCAACYLTFAPVGGAPPAAAPFAASAQEVPAYAWPLAAVGVSLLLFILAGLAQLPLESLRDSRDGASLASDARLVSGAALLLGLGAMGVGALLARRPLGHRLLVGGALVGVALGAATAAGLARAADALARTPLHDGRVVGTGGAFAAYAAAILLAVGGLALVAIHRSDRLAALLAHAFTGLVAFSVALGGSGWWLGEHASRLVALAAARERTYTYVPLPPLALVLAGVALAAFLLRRRTRT